MVVAVVAASLAAGCANDAGNGAPSNGTFAAAAGLETAQAEAADWSEDAELIGLVGGELPDEEPAQDRPGNLTFTPDDEIGDGRAGTWLYTFQTASGDTLDVIVDTDGQTESREESQLADQFGGPIENWTVQSPQAAQTAKEDDAYASVLEAEDAQVIVGLSHFDDPGMPDTEAPLWYLTAESAQQDREETVFVDSETGELHKVGSS